MQLAQGAASVVHPPTQGQHLLPREKSAGMVKAWGSDLHVRHPAGGSVWLI